MCGITAAARSDCVLEDLLSGLSNLEYRGYDSAGIAISNGAGIAVEKCEGVVADLQGRVRSTGPSGTVGIGHTRWSTHGPPTDANAHPHTDCSGRVAVAHNGIIDNHESLRSELEAEGHEFTSETDTEVIPHLVERYLDRGRDPEAAFCRAIDDLSGSFAVTMLVEDVDAVFAARRDSPLVLGIADDGYYLASDVPAFLEYTDRVVYLEDGDVAVVRPDGYEVLDASRDPVEREPQRVDWDPEEVERGTYDHYMLKEIHEQPASLARTIRGRVDPDANAVHLDEFPPGSLADVTRVHLVGCGTSLRAAMYGRQLLLSRGIPAEAHRASEYTDEAKVLGPDELVVGVTQSGETADTLKALRKANAAGARTVALTNVIGSTAARECDDVLPIRAGPEIGVAATKTFSSQVATLVVLAERLLRDRGEDPDSRALLSALQDLPDHVGTVVESADAEAVARRYVDSDAFFCIGRNVGHAVALEGALKMKEISYEHAEGFSAGELKHGPLALVTPRTPVFAVLTGIDDELTLHNAREAKSRGAPVVAITNGQSDRAAALADAVLAVPETHPEVAGILENVYLQLVSYHVADLLERAIDKPRNLAKSVTVE